MASARRTATALTTPKTPKTPRTPKTNRNPNMQTKKRRTAPAGRWDAYAAVREATAGALQALGVMSSFVIFGLGWAMLAGASDYAGVAQGSTNAAATSSSSSPSATEPVQQCATNSRDHEAAVKTVGAVGTIEAVGCR